LCRRADYNRFLELTGAHGADEIDERLHAERLAPRTAAPDDLPDGAFVLIGDAQWLTVGGRLRRWTPSGYTAERPAGDGALITPPTLVEVLRAGWRSDAVPLFHPSLTPQPAQRLHLACSTRRHAPRSGSCSG